MQNVFKHVGMPKAGSTSIQASFNDYDDGSIRYARLGPACHSLRIVATFSTNPDANRFLRSQAVNATNAVVIRRRCEEILRREVALGRQALVISGEAILSLEAVDIAVMDRFFEGLGCRLHVFSYVREPVGFASSAFQQAVKGGRSSFRIRPCRPGYRNRHRDFIDVLKSDRVKFLDFRREHLRAGSVVSDFAGETGIDMARVTEVRANETLSAGAVALLFFWNRRRKDVTRGVRHNLARSLLMNALAEHLPGRFRLSPKVVRSILDDRDIEWMERVAGFPLRERLDAGMDDDDGAIGSEEDLAAARDAALPELVGLVDRLGIGRPARIAAYPVMQRLFKHFARKAEGQLETRKAERRRRRNEVGEARFKVG